MNENIKTNIQKDTLKLIAWVFSILVFFVLVGASVAENKMKECKHVSIKIDHNRGLFFIEESDAMKMLDAFFAGGVRGAKLTAVDFSDMENKIELNPYVENAEVFWNPKGTVHIELQQRMPLVRVVNKNGVSFYLDAKGEKIPPSSKFTARVVVATGNIPGELDPELQEQLLVLVKHISKDNFWKAQFEQIWVTEKSEFELIPKLGNHYIKIGKADDLDKKFNKLMIFYRDVLKNFDADDYREINLKYADQIVCTKNIF